MQHRSPFKHHRFPYEIILCAVRWYLRFSLSYQGVVDSLAERGISVDRSTVYRRVIKFGPEITKRAEKHLRCAGVDWHGDDTYFRLPARRDAKAAKSILSGLEPIGAIKRGHIQNSSPGVRGEIRFISGLFQTT
ncbi:MAG: hypothetical protein ACSHXH_06425 [Marivita sp.]|uniref:hypothetical protein n=1 Tax=Marivita sp. TaxID=2003365 RepID=UPI003EF914E3